MSKKFLLAAFAIILIFSLCIFLYEHQNPKEKTMSPFRSNSPILEVHIGFLLNKPLTDTNTSELFWIEKNKLYIDIAKIREIQLPSSIIDSLPRNTSDGNYTYNGDGIRSLTQFSHEKGDKKRIILLGDSFVFGESVRDNETSSYYLQQRLDPTFQKAEVINMGLRGINTQKEVERLEEKGVLYRPDIVFIFYFPNDYWDTDLEVRLFSSLAKYIDNVGLHEKQRPIMSQTYAEFESYHDFENSFSKFVEEPLLRLKKVSQEKSFRVVLVSFNAPFSHTKRLREIANRCSWDFIYLKDAMGYNDVGIWNAPDGHPSAYANKKIAEYLANYLHQKSIIT